MITPRVAFFVTFCVCVIIFVFLKRRQRKLYEKEGAAAVPRPILAKEKENMVPRYPRYIRNILMAISILSLAAAVWLFNSVYLWRWGFVLLSYSVQFAIWSRFSRGQGRVKALLARASYALAVLAIAVSFSVDNLYATITILVGCLIGIWALD